MMGILRRTMELLKQDATSIDECPECGNWAGYGNRCPDCIEEIQEDL